MIDERKENIIKTEIVITIGLIAISFTFLNTFPDLTGICAGFLFGLELGGCSLISNINIMLIFSIVFFIFSILYLMFNKKWIYFVSQMFFWFVILNILFMLIKYMKSVDETSWYFKNSIK